MKTNSLKTGAVVRLVGNPIGVRHVPVPAFGVVVDYDPLDETYLIRVGPPRQDDDGNYSEDRLWFRACAIRRTFEVGDRVRFTDKVPFAWWFKAGETGTVEYLSPDSSLPVTVCVDSVGRVRRGRALAHVDFNMIELIEDEGPPAGSAASPGLWIVAHIRDDGAMACDANPPTHATLDLAIQEAERLARLNPEATFDVRTFRRVASVKTRHVPEVSVERFS